MFWGIVFSMMMAGGERVGQMQMKQVYDRLLYADIGICTVLVNNNKMYHINSYSIFKDKIMHRIRVEFDNNFKTTIYSNQDKETAVELNRQIPNSEIYKENEKEYRKIILHPNLSVDVVDEAENTGATVYSGSHPIRVGK